MHLIINNYCPESLLNIFHTNGDRNNGHSLRNINDLILPQHRIKLKKKNATIHPPISLEQPKYCNKSPNQQNHILNSAS
jgi:hypothetical protein